MMAYPNNSIAIFAWMILLIAILPITISSFSWPSPKTKKIATSTHHRDAGSILSYQTQNGTDWTKGGDWLSGQATATLDNDIETEEKDIIQQELLEGYLAHQILLKSMSMSEDGQPSLEQYEEHELISSELITDASDVADVSDIASTPILSDVWKARLLLLLSAALYGTNFTFVKALDESMPVAVSSTLRFGFAAVAMLPWLIAPISDELKLMVQVEGNEEPTRLSVGLAGMEIGVLNSVGYISQAIGLKTTTASKSAFICSMAVVVVPILDYIWGKPLLRRQVFGAVLAAMGVYALEMGGTETLNSGDIMSLMQPLMFGLGFWRMEAAMEKYPTEAGRLAASQLLAVFLVSASYLTCWSPVSGFSVSDASHALPSTTEVMTWLHDPKILGALLWTGIVTTAFTIWMETLALKTLSAAETTVIFSTEPLFGAAFASVVAGESLGSCAAVGAAFIISGCLVSGLDIGSYFTNESKRTALVESAMVQADK